MHHKQTGKDADESFGMFGFLGNILKRNTHPIIDYSELFLTCLK